MITRPSRQISIDQQPTQPDGLPRQNREHPLARPALSKRQLLEYQQTMPVQRQKQRVEQQTALPLKLKRKHSSPRLPRVLISMSLGITLLIISFVLQAILGNSPNNNIKSSIIHPHKALAYLSTADTTAHSFMDDMMYKKWAMMWSMLSPEAQRLWQNKNDFVHFEHAKFGSLKFIHYENSPSQMRHSWHDPDTTQIYASIVTFRVSLQAAAPAGLFSAPSNIALNH